MTNPNKMHLQSFNLDPGFQAYSYILPRIPLQDKPSRLLSGNEKDRRRIALLVWAAT